MASQAIGSLLTNGVINIGEARAMIAEFGVKLAADIAKSVIDKSPIFAYHISTGCVTINEVREALGLPRRDDGDRFAVLTAPVPAAPPN